MFIFGGCTFNVSKNTKTKHTMNVTWQEGIGGSMGAPTPFGFFFLITFGLRTMFLLGLLVSPPHPPLFHKSWIRRWEGFGFPLIYIPWATLLKSVKKKKEKADGGTELVRWESFELWFEGGRCGLIRGTQSFLRLAWFVHLVPENMNYNKV